MHSAIKPYLHSWLSTPEAAEAAMQATRIPLRRLPRSVAIIGIDELRSAALMILTECALPPRERQQTLCVQCAGFLGEQRLGARFCSEICKDLYANRAAAGAIPGRPLGHVGSMWSWPEDQRFAYAVREIGYALNTWVRLQVLKAA